MSQQWAASAVDNRNFGLQQQRTLDDLNRPNLQNIVTQYLQDAMRYWQRRPFFFTDTDNTAALSWTASVIVTQGTTIQATPIGGSLSNFVAANAGTTGLVQPVWPATQFTVPSTTGNPPPLPPPTIGTAGTVNDNGIIWLNNGPVIGGFGANTQLTTLYNVNEYTPPIDLIAWTRIEVTWSNTNRMPMEFISYKDLRDLDVIRPTPPTTYPTHAAYYQNLLYLWPYPVALYPITISYRSAPVIATQATDVNIWTTQAEALIRYTAEARINETVIGDSAAAQFCYDLANKEFLQLQQQGSQRDVATGVEPDIW